MVGDHGWWLWLTINVDDHDSIVVVGNHGWWLSLMLMGRPYTCWWDNDHG